MTEKCRLSLLVKLIFFRKVEDWNKRRTIKYKPNTSWIGKSKGCEVVQRWMEKKHHCWSIFLFLWISTSTVMALLGNLLYKRSISMKKNVVRGPEILYDCTLFHSYSSQRTRALWSRKLRQLSFSFLVWDWRIRKALTQVILHLYLFIKHHFIHKWSHWN